MCMYVCKAIDLCIFLQLMMDSVFLCSPAQMRGKKKSEKINQVIHLLNLMSSHECYRTSHGDEHKPWGPLPKPKAVSFHCFILTLHFCLDSGRCMPYVFP